MSRLVGPHGQPISRRFNRARVEDRTIDELLGLSRGIIADGVVADSEAQFLADWLERNRRVADTWPLSVLYERVREMLADGVLDPDEQAELLDTLHELTGTGVPEPDSASASADLPVDRPEPPIYFDSCVFCFTGKFVYGTRKECESEVLSRGGLVKKAPTQNTHYVVVGAVGSRDWIHSSFGRKIEKAVSMRDEGRPISIVAEQYWTQFLSSD